MKWKKLSSLFFALALLFTPVSVSANGWQLIATGWVEYNDSLNAYVSETVKSGGGNFKVCFDLDSRTHKYTLMEYDPGSGNDDKVASDYASNSDRCHTFYSIGNFVDGDNGKAEFYIVIETAYAFYYFYD